MLRQIAGRAAAESDTGKSYPAIACCTVARVDSPTKPASSRSLRSCRRVRIGSACLLWPVWWPRGVREGRVDACLGGGVSRGPQCPVEPMRGRVGRALRVSAGGDLEDSVAQRLDLAVC